MQINEWLDSQLGIDIWEKKYRYENETLDQWFDRISDGNKDIRKLIIEKKFLPAGRILANRGLHKLGKKITLSNCYVVSPPEDSIEGIFECATKLARTFSYGGGVGIDISKLSPKGAKIGNAAKHTSGSVSFMNLFSLVTELIGQSGRRGALMISIDCTHPDLLDFINIKSDLNKVTKANISIRISDDFMKAVKGNKDWSLTYKREETDEMIEKKIKAKELFRILSKMNWDYAEPGILFWDKINNWNLLSEDNEFEYAGVNPCFTGDMRLLTVDGYKPFEDLNDTEIEIINFEGNISKGKVWCNGEKEVILLALSNGETISCTPKHIFMLNDGTECIAENLMGKQLKTYDKDKTIFVEDIVDRFKAKVYEFSEPLTHWGVVEGVVVHNCAEEPLPAGGSCLLGSINVSAYVTNPFTNKAKFDYKTFNKDVEIITKFMNEILDEGLELHPIQEQKDSVRDWRQIGIGYMGIADMFIKLGLKYGDATSLFEADKIGFSMIDTSIKTSALLAKEYGAYPKYKQDAVLISPFFIENTSDETKELVKQYGLRNSQIATIAPTGSLSTMIGISGGIEPIFNLSYTRKTESLHGKDEFYKVYTPVVQEYMKIKNIENEKDLPDLFVTAMTLDYKSRINMQSCWQKRIDASISSTVNLPESATVEDIEKLYEYAFDMGLKGITIYRDGCKRSGILTNGDKQKLDVPYEVQLDSIMPIGRSTIGKTYGVTIDKKSACGKMFVTVNRDKNGNIIESFVNVGKTGMCKSNIDGINRLVSLALRAGVRVEEIADQLKGITCQACTRVKAKGEKIDGLSCSDIIGNLLEEEYRDHVVIKEVKPKVKRITKEVSKEEDNKCPECNNSLSFTGGCQVCSQCGFSFCS